MGGCEEIWGALRGFEGTWGALKGVGEIWGALRDLGGCLEEDWERRYPLSLSSCEPVAVLLDPSGGPPAPGGLL